MADKIRLQVGRKEEDDRVDGVKVGHVSSFDLILSIPKEGEEEANLPEVRFLTREGNTSPEPYGPDRARTWKKASEWLIDRVITRHPRIEDKRYENRVKAEKKYLHGDQEPDYYRWQDDEESLEEVRPLYESVRKELIEEIGRPRREDFDRLFPHQYDDPGLSERARRAVRDLKAVFGEEILVSDL
ncbi:MAG: hypothetical protein ACOC86_01435 [Candidatus Bipolaricaulota bacterium]